jgi:2-methylcitrate dehydratase PrpD
MDSLKISQFIHELKWEHLPEDVRHQAHRCLLDTVGSAIGGRQTDLSRIIHDFAATAYGGQGAHLWLDGRKVSPPGAALANGMTIDSLDIHDSCRPVKGHAGVALVPAALATLNLNDDGEITGRELLTTLVMGYEIAIRAGISLHATACDYHTSGAWNALGCAAVTARRLGLSHEQTHHALGIAEYHGPRSQMMRCIDHPTMLKDGSGWGAMAGVSAGLMAGGGFTGAPALTVESYDVGEFWADLGERWLILEQYFKPYAVCYWAQPAIAGALALQQKHNLQLANIQRVKVFAFHEATRLASRRPQTTEEAQYSLPFPVATALVHRQLGYAELSSEALTDPLILDLAKRVELIEDESFNARFPADRLSRVEIETTDGGTFDSGEVRALWDLSAQASDAELQEKFRWLASGSLSKKRVADLEESLWHCAELPEASRLIDLLSPASAKNEK